MKLVDWDAPSAVGLGALAVGGPGGIPFGPPDPGIANAICQVLDRFNVSAKVRLAAWETAIVESGVKIPPTNDGDSLGPVPAAAAGLGDGEQRLDRTTRPRRSSARPRGSRTGTPTRACSRRRCRAPTTRIATAQRAGQAAALNDKFCG